MGRIAKLISTKIEEFIVQTVEAYFGANVTAETFAPSGDDSPPLENDRIVLVQVDGTGNFVAVGVLSKSQGAKPGEKILYSRGADGEVKAAIKLLNDGKIEMVSPVDFELTGKNIKISAEKKLELEGAESLKLSSQKMELTGEQIVCKGVAQPDGSGCFCAQPYCLFSGAPQTGQNVFNA